jgi:hypothetical protein
VEEEEEEGVTGKQAAASAVLVPPALVREVPDLAPVLVLGEDPGMLGTRTGLDPGIDHGEMGIVETVDLRGQVEQEVTGTVQPGVLPVLQAPGQLDRPPVLVGMVRHL